ncbi:MAG TPA: substrate-binding domain-containing protein, partial [Methylomirabilota bacterium]|nr:substrate-binding domain-containing protein [Methylomirabilota bacterium]
RVPLTTVRQPKYRLGAAAMEAMLRLLKNERPAPRRLPAEIVVRTSTGPPRAVSPPDVSAA